MMQALAKTTPIDALYPPRSPGKLNELCAAIVDPNAERGPNGEPTLRRALTPKERAELGDRRAVLARWFPPGNMRRKRDVITLMMTGLGSKGASEDEAEIIVTAYVQIVADLPDWAVERACNRFASGSVTAAELKVKVFDRGFAPNTAQLYAIASAIAYPYKQELYTIRAVLDGVVPAPRRAADEAATKAKMDSVVDGLARKMTGDDDLRGRSAYFASTIADGTQAMQHAEYAAAGVEIPPGTFVSLSMRLKLGWRIEEVRGRNMLIAPAKAAPRSFDQDRGDPVEF